MAKKQSKEKATNTKKLSIKKIILILLAILVLIFGSLLVLSYANLYPSFIDRNFIYSLDSTVASIPLLPKTPKQIVTKALMTNQENLKSYSVSLNGTVKVADTEILNLKTTGAIENPGFLTGRSSSQTDFESNLIGKGSFATFEDGSTLSFKVNAAPALDGFDFSQVKKDSWYQVDLNTYEKNLGVNVRNDKGIITDVNSEFNKIRSQVGKNGSFPTVAQFKEIKKGAQSYYSVKLNLNNEKIGNTFLGANFDSKITSVSLLIAKNSFFITSYNLVTNSLATGEKGLNYNFNLTYQLSNINQNQNFPSVQASEPINNPLSLYLLTIPNDRTNNVGLIQAATNAPNFSANFLTLERLLKVILLLPKSL